MFDCILGENSAVLHRAVVRGVEVLPHRMVPDGAIITDQKAASLLEDLTTDLAEFKKSIVRANLELVIGYKEVQFKEETLHLSILQESESGELQSSESPE